MHEYYGNNKEKFKKMMGSLLKSVSSELEAASGKPYSAVFDEIWEHYENNMLEKFPYIGGDNVSGTKNLTGAYCLVSMGEVMKGYGLTMEEISKIMVSAYEGFAPKLPALLKPVVRKLTQSPKILNKIFMKKDAKNAENAMLNPGSFETKTQTPPEDGYVFSYHNLICPLSNFAKENGYEEYMPYLCNLDYVMFGVLGVPLFREHTCFEDGDYCDFKIKKGADPLPYWPPVFKQNNPYK